VKKMLAYKCDKCGCYHVGRSDMQVGLDKQGETILKHTLGIVFTPESPEPAVYLKDLCNNCAKSFVEWFKKGRNG